MKVRLEDAVRSGRLALRSAYPAVVTALASALLVFLLWPQPERTFLAESIAAGSTRGEPIAAADVLSWLKSDEVLRGAVANLRSSHPRELSALAGDAAGDAAAAIRARLSLVSLASPDERPRLALGIQAPRAAAALAIADELGRQLAEHHPVHVKRSRLGVFEERERQASVELQAARSAQERLEVELEGLRHAQLASSVAAMPAPASAPTEGAKEGPPSELARMLQALKLERDRLLEIYLPAHPQIQSLSAQISRLEESLRRSAARPELHSAAPRAHETQSATAVLLEWRRREPSAAPAGGEEALPATDPRTELATAIGRAQLDLLAATHRCQEAQQAWQTLANERKQIESAGDLDWRIEPARISTASGGSSPLVWALIAAAIGGLGIAWLATRDQRLTTTAEVRTALGMPVLAALSSGDSEPCSSDPPSRSQAAVQWTTRCSEVVLATFVLTLLAAIVLDQGLIADLTHDPLATLGDLLERLV